MEWIYQIAIIWPWYTLWWTNIAMERSTMLMGKSTINGPFSIAMLVHQRVISYRSYTWMIWMCSFCVLPKKSHIYFMGSYAWMSLVFVCFCLSIRNISGDIRWTHFVDRISTYKSTKWVEMSLQDIIHYIHWAIYISIIALIYIPAT